MKNIFPKLSEEEKLVYGGASTELSANILLSLIPIFIYSVIQLFRFGNVDDYLNLLIGSVTTFITTGLYLFAINFGIGGVNRKVRLLAETAKYFSFLTWFFCIYLVLISGLLSLKELLDGFSIFLIVKSAISIRLGYNIIIKLNKMVDILKEVLLAQIAHDQN